MGQTRIRSTICTYVRGNVVNGKNNDDDDDEGKANVLIFCKESEDKSGP